MKSELNHEVDVKLHPQSQPVNLLDFLEAENSRLRQAVVELSLDTLVLRDTLRGGGRNAA
jgi:hypothetical protein